MAYVARLFSGPDDAVEEVGYRFYDRVAVIDAGECTTHIRCSHCGGDISAVWFLEHGVRFDHLDGFARFEVNAKNTTRPQYELDAEELADVATLLGHPVTQILAHY